MLPQIAQGTANKLWIVPSEMGKALEGLGSIVGGLTNGGGEPNGKAPAASKPVAPKPAAIEAPTPPDSAS